MSCREFSDAALLAAYGEDPGRAFEDHLALCSDCRDEVERVRAVRRAYARGSDERMPLPLRAKILRPRRLAWAMAAGIVLALAVGWMLRPAPTPLPEPATRVVSATPWEHLDRDIAREIGDLEQEIRWHELTLKE